MMSLASLENEDLHPKDPGNEVEVLDWLPIFNFSFRMRDEIIEKYKKPQIESCLSDMNVGRITHKSDLQKGARN